MTGVFSARQPGHAEGEPPAAPSSRGAGTRCPGDSLASQGSSVIRDDRVAPLGPMPPAPPTALTPFSAYRFTPVSPGSTSPPSSCLKSHHGTSRLLLQGCLQCPPRVSGELPGAASTVPLPAQSLQAGGAHPTGQLPWGPRTPSTKPPPHPPSVSLPQLQAPPLPGARPQSLVPST